MARTGPKRAGWPAPAWPPISPDTGLERLYPLNRSADRRLELCDFALGQRPAEALGAEGQDDSRGELSDFQQRSGLGFEEPHRVRFVEPPLLARSHGDESGEAQEQLPERGGLAVHVEPVTRPAPGSVERLGEGNELRAPSGGVACEPFNVLAESGDLGGLVLP